MENVGRRSRKWGDEGSPTEVGDHSLNGYENNVLFWNRGDGNFFDVGFLTDSNRIEDGRGVAVADFDRDGHLDIVAQNFERPAVLLMGRGEAGNWFQLELEGSASNRDGIGAVVTLSNGGSKQVRQVSAGSGFISSSSPILHFGLGRATRIESLEIRWPSGTRESLSGIEANRRLKVRESPPSSQPTSLSTDSRAAARAEEAR